MAYPKTLRFRVAFFPFQCLGTSETTQLVDSSDTYLSVPALVALQEEAKTAERELISIVVRVKRNATAYEKPVRKPGRGRPPIKGKSVKLLDLWGNSKDAYIQTKIMMYGKKESIPFISCDLLWGKPHYQMLRFVIAQVSGSNPIILASTDLRLSPEQILRLYSYRFKIECSFFNLKHTIAGFAYSFWSTATPKLNRYSKSGTDALETVSDNHEKNLSLPLFVQHRGTQWRLVLQSAYFKYAPCCSPTKLMPHLCVGFVPKPMRYPQRLQLSILCGKLFLSALDLRRILA